MSAFSEQELVNYIFGAADSKLAAAIKREARINKDLAAEIAMLRMTSGIPERPWLPTAIVWSKRSVVAAAVVAVVIWMSARVRSLETQLAELANEKNVLQQQIAGLIAETNLMTASMGRLRTEVAFAINTPHDDRELLPPSEGQATSQLDRDDGDSFLLESNRAIE